MPPLPVISGREAAKAFQKIGFLFHHQKGSHMIYYRMGAIFLSLTIASLIEEPWRELKGQAGFWLCNTVGVKE